MKVRTKSLRAGPDGIVPVGSVIEMAEAQARQEIAAGYVEAFVEPVKPPVPQAAAVAPPETAARPAAQPSRRPVAPAAAPAED